MILVEVKSGDMLCAVRPQSCVVVQVRQSGHGKTMTHGLINSTST